MPGANFYYELTR